MSNSDDLLSEVGLLVLAWNQTEAAARSLLIEICGGGTTANKVLTAEMGGLTLHNALRTAATSILPKDLAAHVVDAAKRFGLLKDHRNHYIHGLVGLPSYSDTSLNIERVTARSEFKLYDQPVTAHELHLMSEHFSVVGVVFWSILLDVRQHNAGKPYTLPQMQKWHPLPKIGSMTMK